MNLIKPPIKINLLDSNGDISKIYIFIGSVPDKIKTALEKKQSDVLKKFYGSKWKEMLCINYFGGDDQEISLEDIYALTDISHPEIKIKKDKNAKNKVIYLYDDLFEFDNIFEFKKKIAMVTKIPIYKQHVWYNYNKKIYNLKYNIYFKKNAIDVNLLDIVKNKVEEYIQDIPILINYYNIRNMLKITTDEPFTILNDIYAKGVNEFNLFNLDDFVNKKLNNKNQYEIVYYGFVVLFWPMMSFSVWLDYINNTNEDFEKIYPDLSLNVIKKTFDIESKITNSAINFYNSNSVLKKEIEKNLFIGIISSSIYVFSGITHSIINLRNLFDLIVLSDVIISLVYHLNYEGKDILLTKTNPKNKEKIKTNVPINVLMVRISVEMSYMDIYIYQDGNMVVKAYWPEDKLYKFSDVFEITSTNVNFIINRINKLKSAVINSSYDLKPMSIKNSKFSEIYVSLIYRMPVKLYEFNIIESILKEYADGNIVIVDDINKDTNTQTYYFNKGMYKFDASRIENSIILSNYYNYLTNSTTKAKWQQFFEHMRKTIFQYRHGDIKISIENIKEEEFDIFYMYIINVFAMMEERKKNYIVKESDKTIVKQNIKTLKYQDPILYDFKKIYKASTVYSRICQRQNQPMILNENEYNALDDKKRENVVKYWNFTTQSPANYYCPNPKYPYIQFTTNKHPKKYCIPCCKIKPVQNDIKNAIYKQCLAEHIYEKQNQNLAINTRYIMLYGKYITPGRLCSLPEETIEPLLYDVIETDYKTKYYIYGVEQNIKNNKEVGYIAALAFSLDLTVVDLCLKVIDLIKNQPIYFKMLIDGKIIKYFSSESTLIDFIENTFIYVNLETADIPWNDIFIDIAYYYLFIISVIFDDFSTKSKETIKLVVSNKIANIGSSNYNSLMIIKNKNVYNPIYKINELVYFRTKIIDKKLYNYDDEITPIIQKINDTNVENYLSIYNKFIQTTNYKITKYFVNSYNLCYYIEISMGLKKIYLPVAFSEYNVENANIEYETFKIKSHNTSFRHLNNFIKGFNHWIALESEKKGFIKQNAGKNLPLEQRVDPIYNYIKVDKWIYLDNPWSKSKTQFSKHIIGFIHNNINYYHQPLLENYAKKLKRAPLERILYHPDDINESLALNSIVKDDRVKNITKNIYDFHLYELLLIEFIVLLNKEKNIEMRTKIKKQIINNIDDVISLVDDEDILALTHQINDYIVNHRDKKILLSQIDSTIYAFDRIKLESLKTMGKEQLVAELTKLSKRIVTVVPKSILDKISINDFPNIFVSCQDHSNIYCKKNKLMITSTNLKTLLDIMASDILNPFKAKYIFNPIFTISVINFFKFIKRHNEIIGIITI